MRCACCCYVIPAQKPFAAIKMDVARRVNLSRRRLLVEQIVAVVVLGCGTKVDAMWHVPQLHARRPSTQKAVGIGQFIYHD